MASSLTLPQGLWAFLVSLSYVQSHSRQGSLGQAPVSALSCRSDPLVGRLAVAIQSSHSSGWPAWQETLSVAKAAWPGVLLHLGVGLSTQNMV
jgi:hypothetical protein